MGERPPKGNSAKKESGDLRSQLFVVRRYWWFTAAVLVVALGVTFVLTQRQERIYSASAQVLLRTTATTDRFPFSTSGPRSLARVPENEQLFSQSLEFTSVANELSPPGVSVTSRVSGDLLVFTARGTEPADVAEAATAWADFYVAEQYDRFTTRTYDDIAFLNDQIAELQAERDVIRADVIDLENRLEATNDNDQYTRLLSQKVSMETLLQPQLGPIDQQIASFTRELSDLELTTRFLDEPLASARIERTARVPTSPVSPNLFRNLAVGALAGLALGISLPYLRHALDDKVDDEDDIEVIADLPVLGSIPVFEPGTNHSIEVLERPQSFGSARYQAVLTAIEFASVAEPLSSLLVTSAVPGEGKTTTSVNLAALASRYKNVLLIDGDMRRPTVHKYLGETNDVGLSDVLQGHADVFDVRRTFEWPGTSFDVVVAGPPVEDPALLLRGDAWAKTLASLFLYDLIIVDGPPVLAVTDALLLGGAVDGQVVVSRSGSTKQEDLADATELLASNGARRLGVVVNRDRGATRRHTYYDSYSSEA